MINSFFDRIIQKYSSSPTFLILKDGKNASLIQNSNEGIKYIKTKYIVIMNIFVYFPFNIMKVNPTFLCRDIFAQEKMKEPKVRNTKLEAPNELVY